MLSWLQPILCLSSKLHIRRHHDGRWKSAMVEEFTTYKLANSINWGFFHFVSFVFYRELVYQPITVPRPCIQACLTSNPRIRVYTFESRTKTEPSKILQNVLENKPKLIFGVNSLIVSLFVSALNTHVTCIFVPLLLSTLLPLIVSSVAFSGSSPPLFCPIYLTLIWGSIAFNWEYVVQRKCFWFVLCN